MHTNPGLTCLGGVCAGKNTCPSAAALRLRGSHGTSAPALSALMIHRLSSCVFLRRTSPSQAQRRTTHSPACPSAVHVQRVQARKRSSPRLMPSCEIRNSRLRQQSSPYRLIPQKTTRRSTTSSHPKLGAAPTTNPLVHPLYSYIGDWTQRGLYPSARTYTAGSHPLIRQQHPPPGSTPNHPQPRSSFRCARAAGTGPQAVQSPCTRSQPSCAISTAEFSH